jgi:cytochrome b subunit of formate dehydrogenase/DnaJ-class molecular chaperone
MRTAKYIFLFILLLVVSAYPRSKTPAVPADKSAECLACHSDVNLAKEVDGKTVSLHVDEGKFKASIHGSMFGCTDCHKDIKGFPHEPAPAKVDCASCHAEETENYKSSIHGVALAKGNKQAATCLSCHGSPHEIVVASDENSPVAHQNIPKTCGTCHGQRFVMESSGVSSAPFYSYEASVHGKAVAAGSEKAAVCTDCHGSHAILTAANPKSSIFKFNVPNTCGKCHANVKTKFMESIHGQAIANGISEAPVCTDCHGIHGIKSHIDPNSSVSAQNLARTTCAKCHEGVRLSQDFGIAGGRSSSYLASYHGLASRMGSKVVANCASCHGVHDILPSSDPQSTINPANLAKTCGKCHPGAGENFIKGKIHIDAPQSADIGSVATQWIRRFYLTIIFGTIGFMLAHNLIVWRKKALKKLEDPRRIVVRMDKEQRIQHFLLLSSFILLVITGFALKFPDSWFASLTHMDEKVRGVLHRVAACVMIAVSLYHVYYLAAKKGGRKLAKDMLPVPKDATDLVDTLKYYIGLPSKRPEYARFSYAEKMEYLALVWGTIVMVVTGLMLWFKMDVMNLLPRWSLDIATAVHFYEAVLATLAIIVWHFYAVIFDPDVYPMNWAWFDGKMSVEHYSEEHGLDRESILEAVQSAAEENGHAVDKGTDSDSGETEPVSAGKSDESSSK